jgi:hypothetical protein
VEEPKQGIRAMVGKMQEKVAKMAAIIHTIDCVFNGVEVNSLIPRTAVEAAIKFVKFTSDQIASLYAEFSDRRALAPSLAKVISWAERKGGTISVREIRGLFNEKHRPEGQQVKEWFAELSALKYGEVTSKGQKITFTLSPQPTQPTLTQKPDSESVSVAHTSISPSPHLPTPDEISVGYCGLSVGLDTHTLEPLSDKVLDTTVGSVGLNSPPLENSPPLMMSCTTEISTEDAQKLQDIALIWWPQYYPGQLQSLISQMYGWNAPGAKYDVAVIANWLERQDELIRDRITKLVNQKKASLDR